MTAEIEAASKPYACCDPREAIAKAAALLAVLGEEPKSSRGGSQ